MDVAETGTAIGWIWLVALVGGPILLGAAYAIGISRSRKRAKQGPLSPGEVDRGSTAATPRPAVASGGGEAPVSPPGVSPPQR
jgi:hypothetical protein